MQDDPGDDTLLERTITTNGKYVNIRVNGEIVDRAKVGKKKLPKKYRRLKSKKLYTKQSYTTVAFLAAYKKRARLTILRLTKNNTLVKKRTVSFDTSKRTPIQLTLQTKRKRIIAQVGKGKQRIRHVWTLTKKGALQEDRE